MRLADVKGVGAATLQKLKSLDIENAQQLINFLPKSYIDFNMPVSLADARDGQFSLFKLKIIKVSGLVRTKQGLQFFTAEAVDFDAPDNMLKGKRAKLTWFNQPYMLGNVAVDNVYLCFAKVKMEQGKIILNNPQVELAEGAKKLVGIMPVYKTRGAIKQGTFKGIVDDAVRRVKPEGIITASACDKNDLPSLAAAYFSAHFPESVQEGIEAQKRIALEDTVKEIIYYKIVNRAAKNVRAFRYEKPLYILSEFVNSLPYTLTDTQKKALREIFASLKSDIKMSRLLIGDVGSGKTIVALIAMLYAVKCGYQAAICAPTEILAQQHYRTFTQLLKGENVNVVFHSASVKGAEKKTVEKSIADGSANIIIGTHSIFQKNIEFNNLAFAVIDEQHKFGVVQKYNLQQKGLAVDTLTLTATPIPRSVLMLMYDELQLSEIDKNHETKVVTKLVSDDKKEGLFGYIREEAKKGNQAFIVCPKIFDGEGCETYSALSLYKELSQGVFSDINVALIHGRMKAAEKDGVMQGFARGDIDVLISTTVIEVGIDIKNATTVAILNSDRFGLATLHQLRGRVGRGDKPAFCFLHTADVDNVRLRALTETNDGFKIAELDYTLRGGGDYLGTRQSGDVDGGKYVIPLSPELIMRAKEIAVNDLLPGGIELSADDFNYYYEKFKDITVN